MPSFSPLSMFSARRMRTGTLGLLKIGRPSAASVGARMAPSRQAKARPSCGCRIRATTAPPAMVSTRPMVSSRADRRGVIAHLFELERRGVGEEQQRQGDLGQPLHRFGLRRNRQQVRTAGPQQKPDRHEDHRHGDRPASQLDRQRGVEDDQYGENRKSCGHWAHPRLTLRQVGESRISVNLPIEFREIATRGSDISPEAKLGRREALRPG